MKNIFLFCFITIAFLLKAEPKIIDTGLSAKVPYERTKYAVTYNKYGDGFIRLENLKLQYFSADFSKKWEKELEKVKGLSDLNWFVTQNNENYMFLAQYGTNFKVDKIDAKLMRVGKEGNLISIDLGSVLNFRGISSFHFFDDYFTIIAVSTKGAVTPYSKLDFFTHIVTFGYDLKLRGEVATLPAYTEDKKFNYIWGFKNYIDNAYIFNCVYYLKEDGSISTSNKKNGKGFREIKVDNKANILNDQTGKLPKELGLKHYIRTSANKLRFNQSRYKVLIGESELSEYNFFNHKDGFKEMYVERDGIKSKNLVTQFFNLVSPKLMTKKNFIPKLYFSDAFEDKVNDNIVLITQNNDTYTSYVIILDKNLNVSCVMAYVGSDVGSGQRAVQPEFAVVSQKKSIFGNLPKDYKDNAFTRMQDFDKPTIHTVIDYKGYQLLISDNFKNKTTTVEKFSF